MEKDDDNIQFDQMPDLDWNWGKAPKDEIVEVEKEYDSLFEELLDKCHPGKFQIESVGLEKFNISNEIYSQLLDCESIAKSMGNKRISEVALKKLRDRAVDELGIHISTKKEVAYLRSFLDPNIYIDKKPYNAQLVRDAGALYQQLLNNMNDIRALEQLEEQASTFLQDVDEYDHAHLSEQDYLKNHPNGIFAKEIREAMKAEKTQVVMNETEWFKLKPAESYLYKYPNGVHAFEASFFLEHKPREYLAQYSKGRYVQEAKENLVSNRLALFGGIFILIVVISAVIFG